MRAEIPLESSLSALKKQNTKTASFVQKYDTGQCLAFHPNKKQNKKQKKLQKSDQPHSLTCFTAVVNHGLLSCQMLHEKISMARCSDFLEHFGIVSRK